MREITIAGRTIRDDGDAYLIAEIGANHCGSVELARQLVRVMLARGADAVKLQRRTLRYWAARHAEVWEAPYVSEHAYGETYGAHRAALELGLGAYRELMALAAREGGALFATAFDPPAVADLCALGVPAIKIASASIVDEPLLRAAAGAGCPVILSTGGATLAEIDRALDWLGDAPVALLVCTATYPSRAEELHLRRIETLRRTYPGVVVGLSMHYATPELLPAAYALGARIVEVHVTLSRLLRGSDQPWSLEPEAVAEAARLLHVTRQALGDGVPRRIPAEEPALWKMGRRDCRGVPA